MSKPVAVEVTLTAEQDALGLEMARHQVIEPDDAGLDWSYDPLVNLAAMKSLAEIARGAIADASTFTGQSVADVAAQLREITRRSPHCASPPDAPTSARIPRPPKGQSRNERIAE